MKTMLGQAFILRISMNVIHRISYLFLTLILVFGLGLMGCEGPSGPQGERGLKGDQGEQGPQGSEGNANVQSFDLIVKKADWSNSFHYGGNNNYRFYQIPADSTGGTTVQDFYNAGNAVLAYARLLSEGTYQTEFLNVKQLPLLTTVTIAGMGEVGLRIQLSPTRSEFLLNRTTNGWDSESVLDEQIPPTVEFRLVFIEASNTPSKKTGGQTILSELKAAGVDLNDYHTVVDYFGTAY